MSTVLTEFSWVRGDTFPFTVTIKSEGAPVDLTGFTSVAFCVNTDKDPIDTTNEFLNCVGVIDEDPTTGKVTFSFDEAEANYAGKAYYDIQGVDAAGHKRTFINGYKATFTQDINKA